MGDMKFSLTQDKIGYKKHLETPVDCKKELFEKIVITEGSVYALLLIFLCLLISSH